MSNTNPLQSTVAMLYVTMGILNQPTEAASAAVERDKQMKKAERESEKMQNKAAGQKLYPKGKGRAAPVQHDLNQPSARRLKR